MNPLSIGAIVFLCTFGGSLFGMLLGGILPKHHLSTETRDIIKVAMAMISTLAALVLGLLIASAQSSLNDKETEVRDVATSIVILDRTLAHYGPETQEIRHSIKRMVAAKIRSIWPEEGAEIAEEAISSGGGLGIEAVQVMLLKLSPKNDAQRWIQATALQIVSDIARGRLSFLQQIESRIQWPFLIIVVFWLTIIFTSFGLFAPRNSTVKAVLLVASLSAASSIYLILDMDQPFSGPIKISSGPLRSALEQLGRP